MTSPPPQAFSTPSQKKITYRVDGAADGFPVLMLHGGAGAYPLSAPLQEIAAYFDIRLISLNRPGFAGSDFDPDLTRLADFPARLADWLARSGITRAGVIGICSGAPFALSLAAALPEVVRHAWMLSGMPDIHLPGVAPLFPASSRQDWQACLANPETEIGQRLVGGITDFKQRIAASRQDSPDADGLWDERYERSGIRLDDYIALLDHQLAQDCLPMARECGLLFRPWGFSAADVEAPITLWHARGDTEVPYEPVAAMVRQLPRAQLNVQMQDTHYPSDQTMLQLFDAIQAAAQDR